MDKFQGKTPFFNVSMRQFDNGAMWRCGDVAMSQWVDWRGCNG